MGKRASVCEGRAQVRLERSIESAISAVSKSTVSKDTVSTISHPNGWRLIDVGLGRRLLEVVFGRRLVAVVPRRRLMGIHLGRRLVAVVLRRRLIEDLWRLGG
jgi:hypothetical protein